MSKIALCNSIEDIRKLAKKKLPSVMYDYIEGGSEDEITVGWNKSAFNEYEFVPRVLRDVSNIDLSTTVQGINIDLPIISAPTGMSCMFHHQGEMGVVKATHKAGTIYTLSTVSTESIENVADASNGPLLFQIYIWNNKKLVVDFIERCKKSGYNGLMLAVDLATLGKRERDLRNGHGRPNVLKLKTGLSALTKPAWLYNYLTNPKWRMANMVNHFPHGAEATKVIDNVNNEFSSSVNWESAKELLNLWGGNFILKGIQSTEDAILAAELGATGIVISNHGGRQLDGAPATLDLLPSIVKAVGSNMDILIDGGITRGSDVVKALALGAKACLIGRAYLYGLSAAGEKGVTRSYDILREEMIRVMRLIGCTSVKDLNTDYIKKRN